MVGIELSSSLSKGDTLPHKSQEHLFFNSLFIVMFKHLLLTCAYLFRQEDLEFECCEVAVKGKERDSSNQQSGFDFVTATYGK